MEEYKLKKSEPIKDQLMFIQMVVNMKSIPSYDNLSNPRVVASMNKDNFEIYKSLIDEKYKPLIEIDDKLSNNEIYINLSSNFKYVKSTTIENAVEVKILAKQEVQTIKIIIEE